MEYQYGTQPEYSPVLEDVLSYLQKVHPYELEQQANINYFSLVQIQDSEQPRDIKMRETIYALLSMEGSLRSQMVAIHAL